MEVGDAHRLVHDAGLRRLNVATTATDDEGPGHRLGPSRVCRYPVPAMRLSNLFVPTLRDDPADAEIASHRLLLRAGFIRQVMDGTLVLGKGVAERVVTGMISPDNSKLNHDEITILLHVAAGMDNDEIEQKLNMSATQLIEMNAKIMDKLGVKDRTAAALKALREGLILVEDIHELKTKY